MIAEELKEELCWQAIYSQTCVKRPLKKTQNKDLNDQW